MVAPEVDHHLVQLPLGERGAREREIHELAREPAASLLLRAGLLLRPHSVRRSCGQLPLAALPLRLEVPLREVAAIVVENLEPVLASGERAVVDPFGVELLIDPPHHAQRGDAVRLAGSRPVRETVEGVQGRVVGCEGGSAGRHCLLYGHGMPCPYHGRRRRGACQRTRHDAISHAVILTHSPRGKLTL